MIRTISALLVCSLICLSLVGCGGGNPLIGKWKVDIDKAIENDETLSEATDEEKKAARAMLEGMFSSMVVEFTASEIKMTMGGESKTSSYKITKQDGNKVTIEGKDDEGETRTMTIEVNGDSLVMEGQHYKRAN